MNFQLAMTTAFNKGKFWLGLSIWASVFIAAISISQAVSWIVLSPLVGTGLVVGLQVLAFVCRILSSNWYGSGERIRRMFILDNGMGRKPSRNEKARICEEVPEFGIKVSEDEPPYYESELPVGPSRLVDHIHESAFFTERQAWTSFLIFGFLALIGAAITVVMFVTSINAVTDETANIATLSKAFLSAMSFWVTGDFVSLAVRYFKLHSVASKVVDRAPHARSDAHLESSALILLNDYNCALAVAPTIFEFVRTLRNARINLAWEKSREE